MNDLPETSPLLTPFRFPCGFELPNRVVMAPLTRARAGADRVPNDMMAEYYRQRAGAGLIIAEATVISEEGIGWVDSPGIYNDAQVEGWRRVVDSVHEAGGRIFLQLWHCGRASHSAFHQGELPVAPSAIAIGEGQIHTPLGKKDYETPRPLRSDEIPRLVDDYARAAERAAKAGFDGVEVHSANGYLLDCFLQSKTNDRRDDYGGSVENRTRLLREIVTAVKETAPSGRVGVRLSPNGVFNDMGSPDFHETFEAAARTLSDLETTYLHVMDGLGFGFHELGEPVTLGEGREHFSGALMGNCGYEQDSAEEAIATESADLIAFGRPYISNPDLVARFRNGWPLNEPAPMDVWYRPGSKGYTDFSVYEETN